MTPILLSIFMAAPLVEIRGKSFEELLEIPWKNLVDFTMMGKFLVVIFKATKQ